VRLAVTLGASNAATPAAVEQHEKQTRQQVAVEAIAQDPFVREAQAQLGAQVIEDSIKPI
jgi:DNA polymerase-3 subunit gamma/tau